MFEQDPHDPRLHFERKHGVRDIWSVHVGGGYRALGVKRHSDEIVWFFIGSHADYDKLLP
jgi:hypothetical protein